MSTESYYLPESSIHQLNLQLIDMYEELRKKILYVPQNSYFDYKINRSFSYKFGSYTAKTVKFFKKKETKTSFLVSTWAVETVVVLMSINLMLVAGTYITASMLAAFHIYATYALVTMLTNQK